MLYQGVIAIAAMVAAATAVPANAAASDTVNPSGRLEAACSYYEAGVDRRRLPPLAESFCGMDKPLLIIDRFESDFAVLEYAGQMINLPRQLLPLLAREGDVLCLSLLVDRQETARRRQFIEILTDGLFE